MIGRCSMASFGSCVQAHHGAICRFAMAHARPATTVSSGGEGRVWRRIMDSLAAAHDAAVQMIDTSIVRVHQHAACIAGNRSQSMGRSRGGLTSKIHAVADTNGLPVRLGLTAGEAHDNRLALSFLYRLRSGSMRLADRGYDADWIRAFANERGACANGSAQIQPKGADLL